MSSRVRFVLLVIVCAGAWHQRVAAQQRPLALGSERIGSAAMHVQAHRSPLISSGLLGGAIGVIAGTVAVGLPLAHALEPTDDGLSTPGFIIGFQLGQALGIATGVHLGSGRRGDYRKALLLSAAAAVLGTALLWTGDFDAVFENRRNQIILIAVPVAQLITSIHVARNGS